MQIEIKIPTFTDLCPYCLGSGKVKAMQSVDVSSSSFRKAKPFGEVIRND